MNTAMKTCAAALASVALIASAPTAANAHPAFVAPGWLIVTGLGGAVVGYLVGVNSHPFWAPAAAAPALEPGQLAPGCYWSKAKIDHVWHRVQVCD